MILLDQLGILLTDLPVYLANGLLVILYGWRRMRRLWSAWSVRVMMALLPDAEIQQRAGFRPTPQWRGQLQRPGVPRTAQVMTGIVLAAWLVAQWEMGAPVPWIGAVMWAAGLAAVLALSAQRFNLLWYVKAGIAMYALAVIGSRIYLGYTSPPVRRSSGRR